MPVGKPSKGTIAKKKYEDKVGIIPKTYKLRREVADAFAEACDKAGVSASGQIAKMMKEFIEEVNKQ